VRGYVGLGGSLTSARLANSCLTRDGHRSSLNSQFTFRQQSRLLTVYQDHLLYFPARGRAEQIRLVFAYKGAAFTESSPTDWLSVKPTTPFGQLPVYTERSDAGEIVIAESGAILRHLARRFDMYGNTRIHYAICDALADFVADARTNYIPIAYAALMKTPEDTIAKYWDALPQTLGHLERALTRSTAPDAGWFVCDTVTFADVATFDYLDGLETLKPDCLRAHPGLVAFVARFRALPTVATYLANRK